MTSVEFDTLFVWSHVVYLKIYFCWFQYSNIPSFMEYSAFEARQHVISLLFLFKQHFFASL